VGEALGWEGYPWSMQELTTTWLRGKFGVSFQTGLACFAALAWAIWLARNNMCIRRKFLNSTCDIVHHGLSYAQKWRLLMTDREKTKVEGMIKQVLDYLREFEPLHSNPSDVGFIC
jgi:hypothetical protein